MVKCIIAGSARNITKTWEKAQVSLERIFDACEDYRCVIVESHSDDGSFACLQEWASADSRRHVITLGNSDEPVRTKRIAAARNAYLSYSEPIYSEFPYMIVVDLDNVLDISETFNAELASCFVRNDWDALASNRKGRYYDIWALRCNMLGCNYDCWEMMNKQVGFFNGELLLTTPQRWRMFIGRHQRVIPQNAHWIPCDSAFGGMAIYKTSKIKGRRYNGDATCEHISFHLGLRMFINPAFNSGGDNPELY